MKFTSIFFTASAYHLGVADSKVAITSEKYEVYFDIFHSECLSPWSRRLKGSNNECSQTSMIQKYEVYFDIFHLMSRWICNPMVTSISICNAAIIF